ncbi:MAG: long-chain fatty acid--CoA ligase [Acidobacteria bacterium]|nr:MAG: long-chain fatty acid--CoA ligase [Acidobacteriota bacterium]
MTMHPILDCWDHLLRRDAQRIVVVHGEGELRATVGDVDRLARDAARRLSSLPAGGVVLLEGDAGPGFLAALLACWRGGLTPALAPASGQETTRAALGQALGCCGVARLIGDWPADEWLVCTRANTSGTTMPAPPGGAPGVLKLTSGSSGAPRAVHTTAEQLAADDRALTATMGLDEGDRILAAIPLNHSYGLASVALPPLVRGAAIVQPSRGNPFAPAQAACRHQVTFLPTTPAYLAALVAARRPPPVPSSLRLVISAGAPLTAATAEAFRATYGLAVHTFYGSSETGGITFDRRGGAAERGTVGEPVEGVEVSLQPLSAGDRRDPGQGTVVVRSPAVASGYFPTVDERLGDGRFVTGDLGRFSDDGRGVELALLGRTDRVLNLRGRKLDPRELESIVESLSGVREAAALQIRGEDGAPGALRLVVAGDADLPDAARLRDFLHRRLPPHERPRSVVFVTELPRNERGKIDFAAMQRPDFR